MKVPTMIQDKVIDRDGTFYPTWQITFDQLFQELQQNFGDLGIVVPTLSSDPNSVIPPFPGGQIGLVEQMPFKPALLYDSFTDQLKFRKTTGFVVIV